MGIRYLSSNDFTLGDDNIIGELDQEISIRGDFPIPTDKVDTRSGNDLISATNSSWALSVSTLLFMGSGADTLTGLCARTGSFAEPSDFLLGDLVVYEAAVIRMGAGGDRVNARSINGLAIWGELYTGGGNDIVQSAGRIYGRGRIFLGEGADTIVGCLAAPSGLDAHNPASSLRFYGGSGQDRFVLLEGVYKIATSEEPGMSYKIEAVSGASFVPENAHLTGIEYLGAGANAVSIGSLRAGLINVSNDGVISQPA